MDPHITFHHVRYFELGSQPEEPKVLYIIPTFRWEGNQEGHRRVGGGLRVYLDRPWFSSGDGEQLAVILFPNPTAESPEYAKTRVTQWGLDPLWEDGPGKAPSSSMFSKMPKVQLGRAGVIKPRSTQEEEVTSRGVQRKQPGAGRQIRPKNFLQFGVGRSHPTPENFRNPAAIRHGLRVKEVTVAKRTKSNLVRFEPMAVTICAFDVKPDISRQLWYCDIEMDPGTAYFPFVRLALARYQVNSISGAHLSPIVLADFVQLVPDRSASVVVNQGDTNQVLVTVAGIQGSASSARGTKVEVEIEEFNPNVTGELGWSPVPNAVPIRLKRVNPQQWTGQVTIPPPDGKQHLFVIKEYESIYLKIDNAIF